MTIIGPNASGKSNILRVLSFLKFWISESFGIPPDMPITNQGVPYRALPFLYTSDKESRIECIFETKDTQYKINLTLLKGFATEETLFVRSKTKERTTWKTLFSREDSQIQESPIFRRNASILFVKHREGDIYSHDIINYWKL